jgi:hypothetical protein
VCRSAYATVPHGAVLRDARVRLLRRRLGDPLARALLSAHRALAGVPRTYSPGAVLARTATPGRVLENAVVPAYDAQVAVYAGPGWYVALGGLAAHTALAQPAAAAVRRSGE